MFPVLARPSLAMQEFDDVDLEPFAADSITIPLLRLNDIDLPSTLISVGGQRYQYDRSYPIKGYGAIMPPYVAEQMAAGRKPLVIERLNRYYLYFAVEEEAPAAPTAAAENEPAEATAG